MTDYDVILIDMGSVFAAAWHAGANEAVSYARQRTLTTVRKLADGHKAVAVCCDARSNWRKTLAPSYKEQREPKPEAYFEEMRQTEEGLRRDGVLVWKVEGYEADDLIATAALEAYGNGLRVLVHSSDKDLLQLVRDDSGDAQGAVTACSVRDGRTYHRKDVLDKFGVTPVQMRDYLALVGDASDNIAGVTGIGPKRASDLLRAYPTADAALAAVQTAAGLEAVARVIGKSCAFNLKSQAEQLKLAQELVTLKTDAPIEFGELFATREQQPIVETPAAMVDDDTEGTDIDETELNELFGEQPANEQSRPKSAPPPAPERSPQPDQAAPRVELVKAAPPQASQAIALAAVPYELQLEPRNPNQAMQLAGWLVNSRLYSRYSNQEAIFAVIMRGREMGLGALAALDAFHVVEGKPTMHAHLIVARAKALPECEWFRFVKGDSTFAEFATKHRDNPSPTTLRYTLEDARQAGLFTEIRTSPVWKPDKTGRNRDVRGNWEKRPAEMLRKTCAVQLVRIEYPEAAMGLYTPEELEEVA